MASWQSIAEGPYQWRTEGPLAYYYHVLYDLGVDWLAAPLPPPYTLERWLRYDDYTFELYWPHWHQLAKEGRWDALYPQPPPGEHTTPVYVGPHLPPVSGFTAVPETNTHAMPDLTLADLEQAHESALRRVTGRERDPLASPVDGANDMPRWLRTIDQVSRVAERSMAIFGLGSAQAKQQDQARAVTGRDQRPSSQAPPGVGVATLGGLSLGTLLIIALVVWLVRK